MKGFFSVGRKRISRSCPGRGASGYVFHMFESHGNRVPTREDHNPSSAGWLSKASGELVRDSSCCQSASTVTNMRTVKPNAFRSLRAILEKALTCRLGMMLLTLVLFPAPSHAAEQAGSDDEAFFTLYNNVDLREFAGGAGRKIAYSQERKRRGFW